jgi:hypothetical protein
MNKVNIADSSELELVNVVYCTVTVLYCAVLNWMLHFFVLTVSEPGSGIWDPVPF